MSVLRSLGGLSAVGPNAGRRHHWLSGDFMLISIGVGFGIATLFATGFLFMAQVIEDFRRD
jgi:hypothetical protein